jgi:hypothetical protein
MVHVEVATTVDRDEVVLTVVTPFEVMVDVTGQRVVDV